MTFQHQFHLKLDFSQMTVYCTGTYTQRKTVKSCKKTYITLKSGRKRGVWNRYTLKGHILEDVKEAKYLRLTLSSNLTWNTHIGNITSKSNKLLGFLRRNLKMRNESTKENAYKAIVRSNLEYCSTVWAPHTKKNKDEIEKVQRRAARFVTGRYHNTSSVSSMIDHLNWESLEQRRQKARVIMLYKIIHNEVDINPQSYLKKQERTTRSAHPFQFQTYSPTIQIMSNTASFRKQYASGTPYQAV